MPTPEKVKRRLLDDSMRSKAQELLDCMRGFKGVFKSENGAGVVGLDYRVLLNEPYFSWINYQFRLEDGDPVCYVRDTPVYFPDLWIDLGKIELHWPKDPEPDLALKEILYNEPGK